MFLILGLPRSRTFWLSKLLTYRDFECGHEEARHLRSLEDAKIWLNQDHHGSAETYVAPFWRLAHTLNPNLRIVTIRRPIIECVESLMALDLSGICTLNRGDLEKLMVKLDAKLDQIERRLPNVLSVEFHDLDSESTVESVWRHCLPYAFDRAHWLALRDQILTCDMRALMRYAFSYRAPLEKMVSIAGHYCRAQIMAQPPKAAGGVTFQQESFDDWERDGVPLFEAHCVEVGESPQNWKNKNIPFMHKIYDAGGMQITTARCNGRMFGYLMALIAPALDRCDATYGYHATRYVSPDMPGLALKLERASVYALRQKGVKEVVFRAGIRSDGPRTDVLYRRMGAEEFGSLHRLQLDGA